MWGFATAALFLAAFAVLWLRLEPMLRELIALKTERERTPAALSAPEPIPADLIAYTKGFDAEWAREQSLDRCYELYAQLGNWNNVRQVLLYDAPRTDAQIEN